MILTKRIIFSMMLLSLLILVAGCNDGSTVNPPTGLDYGPPLREITFCDANRVIGTTDENATEFKYIRNSGTSNELGSVDYGMYWYPGDIAGHKDELLLSSSVSGASYSSLKIIDDEGAITTVAESMIGGAFNWSGYGSRIFYVAEEETEYLIKEYVISEELTSTIGIIAKQSYSYNSSRLSVADQDVVVSLTNIDDVALSELAIFNDGEKVNSINARAISPQYSPDGDLIAYLNGDPGKEFTRTLVIIDENLSEDSKEYYTFTNYGEGAASFAWSPDGTKIALYTGLYANLPKLVVIDLLSDNISEIVLEEEIVTGDEEDYIWAAPTWNPESDKLLLYVNDNNQYNVVIVDLVATVTPLVHNLGANSFCRPDWREAD